MLIHRYMPADKCLKFLSDLKLEASLPSKQNDPFELAITGKQYPRGILKKEAKRIAVSRGVDHNNKLVIGHITESLANGSFAKALTNDLIKNADNLMRFISFSATDCREQSQILMWSHYARGHHGFRIELDGDYFRYDSGNQVFREVRYSHERLELDWLNIDNEAETLKLILSTKFKAWEYEKEYRLIVSPADCPNDLLDIPRQSIKAIYSGAACSAENISRAKKLVASLSNNREIKFFTSSKHDRDFKIIYTEEPL